jgi:hypothetical protein
MKTVFILVACLFTCYAMSSAQVVNVTTSSQLTNALNNAVAGQTIQLADGVYTASAGFRVPAGRHGTANNPITIVGSRNAVLTTGNNNQSNCLWLQGNNYWALKGFTARTGKKGIMIDSSFYTTVDSVRVVSIGEEGIHLRKYSSYCTIKNCSIDSIGIVTPDFGEGIYIGSAVSNWCEYTNCGLDTCNYNKVFKNQFGTYIRAENIDVKEGTCCGVIQENNFNGAGLANQNSGDSWMDVKGNYYRVETNTGINSLTDGIQTNIRYAGYGNFNTFNNNTFNVNAIGYGFRIQTSNSNGTALNNVVCNNNTITNASLGISNITTQTCSAPILLNIAIKHFNYSMQQNNIVFNWQLFGNSTIINSSIEYAANGINFTTIQTLTSNATNAIIDYEKIKNTYCRLKIVAENKAYYSNVVFINAHNNSLINIAATTSLIAINNTQNKAFNVQIFNTQGVMLHQKQISTSISWLHGLKTGVYYAQIISANRGSSTQKIFIP